MRDGRHARRGGGVRALPRARSRSDRERREVNAPRRFDLLLDRRSPRDARTAKARAIVRDGAIGVVGDAHRLGRAARATCRGRCRRPQRRDFGGAWATPGLVDCHTHLVYAGNRAGEFERRLRGATYARNRARRRRHPVDGARDARGGRRRARRAQPAAPGRARGRGRDDGRDQVRLRSRDARRAEAARGGARARARARRRRAHDAARRARGAAGVRGARRRVRSTSVCARHRSRPRRARGSPMPSTRSARRSASRREQTRRVFEAARAHGLPVKLHADQLSDQDGAALAAEFGALSADHLEYTNDARRRRDGAARDGRRAAARRVLRVARDAAAAGRRRCASAACRWRSRPTAIRARRRRPRCC